MIEPCSLSSFELPVLSYSTAARDINECDLSECAPVAVIDDSVGTEVSFRTFNKSNYVTTETFFPAGQITKAEEKLYHVNLSHAVG